MLKQKIFLIHKSMPNKTMKESVFLGFYIKNPHLPFCVFTPITLIMLAMAIFILNMSAMQILVGLGISVVCWDTIFGTMIRK